MRPIPIPDALVPDWGTRHVIAPPDGDLLNDEIRPVEAIVAPLFGDDGEPIPGSTCYSVLIQIEDGDWEAVEATRQFLITFEGSVVPFGVKALVVRGE